MISGDNAVSAGCGRRPAQLHGEAMRADGAAKNCPTHWALTPAPCGRTSVRRACSAITGIPWLMTGDGVNDVLALATLGYRCGDGLGRPASRAVAQIVLLNNRFATLPHVVGEGRRVIAGQNGSPPFRLRRCIPPLAPLVHLIAIPLRRDPLLHPFQRSTSPSRLARDPSVHPASLRPTTSGPIHRLASYDVRVVPFGLVIGVAIFACRHQGRYARGRSRNRRRPPR